ncbi:hypothetical protein CEXT_408541 [Caerostris extrusa]|uniref:Uncharacterized protein n=1 Tax=Caerostris extrusa TaxID=172846 RepID=A0AAV4STU5_CAEEX|nr:hypothetical protein CEXT_408541 [Caerostris extrusa]
MWINLSSIISIWNNQEEISTNLFSTGSIFDFNQSLSSGTIRNRSHPITFHLEQSGIDLIQILLTGSIRNLLHPISFSTGPNRNQYHPIFFHLEQSEAISSIIFILINHKSIPSISFHLYQLVNLSDPNTSHLDQYLE